MRRSILIGIFLLPFMLFAQKQVDGLKKKYYGKYVGEITSFQLDSGKDLVAVDSTGISVEIDDSTVLITIGKNQLKGKYDVMFEAKTYFLLDCRMEGQLAGERIVVYKKGKKISRDGLYPQPNAFLYRKKD
jgi:hypothetical protein